MIKGKVIWFNDQKGYGFIAGDDGHEYFIHHTGIIMPGYRKLEKAQSVEFESEDTSQGKKAFNLSPV